MPVARLPFANAGALARTITLVEENATTAALMRKLRPVRVRGYLTRQEFLEIARWKSPRALHYAAENDARRVRLVTGVAFSIADERSKMAVLTSLLGIGIPMGSAILTLTNPNRYAVLDIRVWQILHSLGSVKSNSKGTSFTLEEWHQFLIIVRKLAAQVGLTARDVERTLFELHKKYQVGTLYESSKQSSE
jgi:hypothetical protein